MQNTKESYTAPEIELILIEDVDIITTSDPDQAEWDEG